MAYNFSADEVFAIAEQIEVNGGKFYRQAAEVVDNGSTRKTLQDLAAMEDEHELFFAGLRAELEAAEGEPLTFDPEGEAATYLKAFADGHVFEADKDSTWKFTGEEQPEDVLRIAIRFEKDAIVYFLGLKDLVAERLGKGKIDALIKEEQRHIVILTRELTALKKARSS
jgi:rubrerythrin